MEDEDIFYNLIKQNFGGLIRQSGAQSYLLCSKDKLMLMLLARLIVENDCGGRFYSPDVKIFPQNDKHQGGQKAGPKKTAEIDRNGKSLIYGLDGKLSVADIEEITTTATLTPLELKYKYYILKNGETLNDASSNKLLKTLEEPPKTVKIIILSENELAVLPTIRSRCRIINPSPLSNDELHKAADTVFKDSPLLKKAKRLSGGSLTRLVKAAEGGLEQVEQLVFDTLINMKSSRNQAVYSAAIIKHKDEIAEIIDMFELVMSEVLLFHCGVEVKPDYKAKEIGAIAKQYSADTLIRLKPALDKARQRLRLFGNAASITDEFLFSLLEVRQKCQS